MKTLYLDCGMGAAGDMLTAALTELLPEPEKFIERLNGLGIPKIKFIGEKSVKCGITGTHMSVTVDGIEENEDMHHHHGHEHEHHHSGKEQTQNSAFRLFRGNESAHDHEHHHHHHHHHHRSMQDIEQIVGQLKVSEKVRGDILAVYRLIAEAESHAHGKPVSEIHFHEVGHMDAIADITAVCMLMEELSPDEIIASTVRVGRGHVKCAHGLLPVPAPATAHILKDIPIYAGKIEGELCTPTGAALLKHFVTRFESMPAMKVTAIGYGMGKKDFPKANCLRAMLGEPVDMAEAVPEPSLNMDVMIRDAVERELSKIHLPEKTPEPAALDAPVASAEAEDGTDTVLELSCNVDDMTGEAIGFAMERLFEGGAKEVYTVPVGMKKSRPGTLIRVMCSEQDREKIIGLLFRHTTTIGVRETLTRRYVLDRRAEMVVTDYGEVKKKVSSGYGVTRTKYEYDDISRIARGNNMSLDDVKKMLK